MVRAIKPGALMPAADVLITAILFMAAISILEYFEPK